MVILKWSFKDFCWQLMTTHIIPSNKINPYRLAGFKFKNDTCLSRVLCLIVVIVTKTYTRNMDGQYLTLICFWSSFILQITVISNPNNFNFWGFDKTYLSGKGTIFRKMVDIGIISEEFVVNANRFHCPDEIRTAVAYYSRLQ